MIHLPNWIKEIFKKSQCPHNNCDTPLQQEGVYGVGIREDPQSKIFAFCYEYQCPKCSFRTVFTGFPTTFEDFISDLIDINSEIGEEDVLEEHFIVEPIRPKKSGITPKEISDGIRLINSSPSFEDLLYNLGIPKLDKEKKKDENK